MTFDRLGVMLTPHGGFAWLADTPCEVNYRGRTIDGTQFDASDVGTPGECTRA